MNRQELAQRMMDRTIELAMQDEALQARVIKEFQHELGEVELGIAIAETKET